MGAALKGLCLLVCLGACAGPQKRAARPHFTAPHDGVFYDPVALVVSTEDDLLPTLSSRGGTVAYAGRVDGNLDIYKRPLSGGAAVRLTAHSTDDTDPAFSPDGRLIAWVSQAEDVKGDIWIMDAEGGHKRRLTGRETADQAPFWSPDGTTVYFTSRVPGSTLRRIDSVVWSTGARRTVVAEGWDGSLSPDGRVLFYVRFNAEKNAAIVARRLDDGREVPLTAGAALEATPHAAAVAASDAATDAFPVDGGQTLVLFARFVDDVNDDGVIDIDDAPSLWSVMFSPARFDGAPPATPQPLTAGEGGEIFPAVTDDWFVYTAAGRGALEIFALPLGGVIAADASPAAILHAGRAARDPALRRLARRALIARSPQMAATAHYELGRELSERGKLADARAELTQASSLAGDTELGWVANLEGVRLALLHRLDNRLAVRNDADREFVTARMAEVQAAQAAHADNAAVQARAQFILAECAYAQRQRGRAVDGLERVVQDPHVPKQDGARAAMRLGEFYEQMGDVTAVARIGEIALRRFAEERFETQAVAERWVRMVSQSATGAVPGLEALQSGHADLALVASRAAAALARRQQAAGETLIALQSWQRIAQNFAQEREILVEALLAIGATAVGVGQEQTALAAYEQLLREFPELPARRAEARRGLTALALKTGRAQERQGDFEAARQTYDRLLATNPELVAAQRRSIALAAQLGDLPPILGRLDAAVKRAPHDKFARYAYGYALTFSRPARLTAAEDELEAALALEPRFAAAQLTLGWVRLMRESSDPGQGWLESAAESFETARGLTDPQLDAELWAAATLNKGNALFALGKLDDAFQSYLELQLRGVPFETAVTEVLFYESFSRVALRVGELDVALDMAYQARKLLGRLDGQPRGDALVALLAALSLQAGRLDDALRLYDDAVTRYTARQDLPHLVPMLRGQALALRAVGRNDEALAVLARLFTTLQQGEIAVVMPRGFFVTEIAANAGNVSAAVYGFDAAQEEDIARVTAARILRQRLDCQAARAFYQQHIALVRRFAEDPRQGPRMRLELLYALHEGARAAVGAGAFDEAAQLWQQALPLAVADARWQEAATLLESLQWLDLQGHGLVPSSLTALAAQATAAGAAAEPLAPELARRFARLTALGALSAAVQPIAAPPGGVTTQAGLHKMLQDLDALGAPAQQARVAAKQSGDAALQAHIDSLLGAVAPATDWVAATWQQAFDRAMAASRRGTGPDPTWLRQAQKLFESPTEPADPPVEQGAFVAAAVQAHLQNKDLTAAWTLLERDRLRRLQPPPERLQRTQWATPLRALRALRGPTQAQADAYAAELKGQSAMVRALEAAPAPLDEVRVALESDTALVQVFAPTPSVWHWFIIDRAQLQHVETPPSTATVPAAVQAALSSLPITAVYVDTGELLGTPAAAWRLAAGTPPQTLATSEVLSATYLLAAYESRNLARAGTAVLGLVPGGDANARPVRLDTADPAAALAAQGKRRTLLHIGLPGRTTGPALGRAGLAQVVFGPPPPTASGALDLNTLAGLPLDTHLAVVDQVDATARTARAIAQSLLLAGIPSAWIGAWGQLPQRRELLHPPAQSRLLQAPIPPAVPLRFMGYRGMDTPARVTFAAQDLLRLVKLGTSAFKTARERQDNAHWQQARDLFARALDALNFLQQPAHLDLLQKSPDKLHARLPALLGTLQNSNEAVLAEIYLALKQPELATALRQALLARQEQAGNTAATYEAMMNLGRTLSQSADHAAAASQLERCVALARQHRDGAAEAACQVLLGSERRELYDYHAAQAAYEAAVALQAPQAGAAVVQSRRLLGFLHETAYNRYDAAQDQFTQALDDAQLRRADDLVPRLMLDIARINRQRGDFEKALAWVEQASTKLNQAPPADRAAAALEAAKIYWYRGAYRSARTFGENGLNLARAAGDGFLEIQARSLGGLIALNQGNLSEAEAAIGDALALSRSLGRRSEEATQLNNLGTVLRESGRLDEAVRCFKQALHIDEVSGSTEGRAYDLRNLATAYARQGQSEPGLQAVRQALALSRRIGNRYNELQCLAAESEILEMVGSPQAKERGAQTAQLAFELAVPEVEWRALYALGRRQEEDGDTPGARAYYDEALAVAQHLGRGRQESQTGRTRDDLYADAIRLAIDSGDAAAAYAVCERGHARTLLDVLATQEIALPEAVKRVAIHETQRREALLAAQRAKRQGLLPAAGDTLAQAAEQHRAALASFYQQAPQLARAMTLSPVSLVALQARLPADTRVLIYFIGAKQTAALVVGQTTLDATMLPIDRQALRTELTALRAQMRAFAPVQDTLQSLFAQLVQPVWSSLKEARQVVIVPHGMLFNVPFAALPVAPGSGHEPMPLWQHVILSQSLTASHLFDSLSAPPPLPIAQVAALAPADDLPFAKLEARAVATQAFGGADATLTRLAQIAENHPQALDIAAHGRLDGTDPLGSALLLTADLHDDGRLEIRQVLTQSQWPSLVTLSACESAGNTLQGAEWLGLGQAFLAAGAKTVVASQNRVSDLATAVLIKRFYRLAQSKPSAEALRDAAMGVRQRFAHPAHWANFVLLGDPR